MQHIVDQAFCLIVHDKMLFITSPDCISFDRYNVLNTFISWIRLEADPGSITLLSEADMEILAEMDTSSSSIIFSRYDAEFLRKLQEAAQRHLVEKSQIRDTLALLKIYHRANEENKSQNNDSKRDYNTSSGGKRESARKRQKANQDTVDN